MIVVNDSSGTGHASYNDRFGYRRERVSGSCDRRSREGRRMSIFSRPYNAGLMSIRRRCVSGARRSNIPSARLELGWGYPLPHEHTATGREMALHVLAYNLTRHEHHRHPTSTTLCRLSLAFLHDQPKSGPRPANRRTAASPHLALISLRRAVLVLRFLLLMDIL